MRAAGGGEGEGRREGERASPDGKIGHTLPRRGARHRAARDARQRRRHRPRRWRAMADQQPGGAPIAARLRASLRAALSAPDQSPALAYADAGVAEAMRAAGVSVSWLAATARIGLLADLTAPSSDDAPMATALLAGLDRDGDRDDDPSPSPPAHPDRLLLLLSTPASLPDAVAALQSHGAWAVGRTTLLATAATASGQAALRALATTLEAEAGWPARSIAAARLAGCEWAPAGEAAFFVLPAAGAAAVAAASAWPYRTAPAPAASDDDDGANDDRPDTTAARAVGAALAAGAADAGLTLEPFALGPSPVAAAVAAAVAEEGTGGGGVKTALIVVDARVAAAALAAPADHPVDRALGLLPRLDNDVAVDVAAACAAGENEAPSPSPALPTLPHTILHAAHDADGGTWLDAMLGRRGGDARLLLRKWLREAARAENRPVPARARQAAPTADELASLVAAVGEMGRPASCRARALGAAAALASRHPDAPAWDAAAAAAAALDIVAAEGGDAAGRDAADAVAKAADGPSFAHALALVLAAYSHAIDAGAVPDPATGFLLAPEAEAALSAAVAAAVGRVDWPWLLPPPPADAAAAATPILARLRAAACVRGRMLPPPLRPPPSARPTTRLSADLAERLAARRPIPDAHHVSTSLRALLAGAAARVGAAAGVGLGLRGRGARTTPADCDAAIIFFVGGIAVADARGVVAAAADAAAGAAGTPCPVSLGGTCLLSPDQAMRRVLDGCFEEGAGAGGGARDRAESEENLL